MISLCNRVRELSIIKISVESRALLSCHDLKKIKRIKRLYNDLMGSDNFVYKKFVGVDKHTFGHCCN